MSSAADALFLRMALGRLRAHWWEAELREPALTEIARLCPGDAALELDDADRRLLTIARHGADVLRGYSVPLVSAPYIMTMTARDVVLPGLRTDAEGFRVTMQDGAPLRRDAWEATTRPQMLVVGNSSSWGVGVQDDASHVASMLNARGDVSAFNASVKGTNLVQQRLMVDRLLPTGGTAVIVGGVLDLIFALSWPRDDAHGALAFWNAGDADLTRDGEWALEPGAYGQDEACRMLTRELQALGAIACARDAQVLFVMQPHLDFVGRAPLPDEARLAEAFVQELGAFRPVHASGVLQRHAAAYSAWMADACANAGVQFVDTNTAPEFLEPGPWFLDHIHLTDAGHAQLAQTVRRSLGLTHPAGLTAQPQRPAA
ncbi:MAG TPA: GDSL-type esterase/lipase family protein [Gemmatimonas sp.]|uniref:GDSL-type esterase/lipase family protein n=1 Tax=Gemmatimonas sp. TaxID=1962908 RepID=UPI002ED88060